MLSQSRMKLLLLLFRKIGFLSVSLVKYGDNKNNLMDDDGDNYWESNSYSEENHWIRLKLKKNLIVKCVCL